LPSTWGKMKLLASNMAFVGKKLDDEDLVSYILAGLDTDFDSVISVVAMWWSPQPRWLRIDATTL
jgi:hypothetical protein